MRIGFIDFMEWDYNVQTVYQEPLGGSQSAACYLAAAMAEAGHAVVYFSCTKAPGVFHGVQCVSLIGASDQTLRSHGLDALIVVLAPGNGAAMRGVFGPQTRLVLWTQHAPDQPAVQILSDPRERDAYDGFALVSDWQLGQFQRQFGINPSLAAVLRNAISPAFANRFAEGESILPRKSAPPVLAYTSTPFRGLDLLLDCFPDLRRQIPGLRLQVFSSMKVYRVSSAQDEASYGTLYERCRAGEGVEYIGSVPQPKLAEALASVAALAYPNTFAETSCISVMEAMASGCRIITSDLGALPETAAGFGKLIPIIGVDRDEYLRQFTQATVEALRENLAADPSAKALLRRQVDFVNSSYTWRARAGEWTTWLASLPGSATRPPRPASGLGSCSIRLP